MWLIQQGEGMSNANFSLTFRGASVENGEIDVNDLAPAMLAVGDMFQAANKVVNGENAEISVKVKATAQGCFEVDLTLIQQVVESIFTYSKQHKEGIAAAQELADLVLTVTGSAATAGGGLFFLLKWLRGKKPEKIVEKNGDVFVHIGDNHFHTNKKTIMLAENREVREGARKLAELLNREGIDTIEARKEGEDGLQLNHNDVPSFAIPETEDQELQDEVRRMTLQIISLSFKEDNKWRLTDGGDTFTAGIEDESFLNQIAQDQITFGKNDYLICDIRERQIATDGGLKKEITVLKVVDHKPAARQLNLLI